MLRISVVLMFGVVMACSSINERPDGGTTGGDGGASGSNSPDTFMSGTRIKARATTITTTTVDGAKNTSRNFSGWFDSMRNEPCSPATAADTKTRCLPTAVAASTYFVDAQCAQPTVIVMPSGAVCAGTPMTPPPKYIAVPTAPGCASMQIRAMGTRLSPTNWYQLSGATCTLIGAVPATWEWYGLGALVDATQFAEFVVTTTVE